MRDADRSRTEHIEHLKRVVLSFGLAVSGVITLVVVVVDPGAVWEVSLTALLVVVVFLMAVVAAGALDWWQSQLEERRRGEPSPKCQVRVRPAVRLRRRPYDQDQEKS
jgi:uncharacterized membrane protein (DUF4010 family)